MKKYLTCLLFFCTTLSAHWHHNREHYYPENTTSTKVAICSDTNLKEANIDNYLGKAPYFIIYTIENKEVIHKEIIKNPWANQYKGSGPNISRLLNDKNVNYVICKRCGSYILNHLDYYHIEVIYDSGKVDNALNKFINRK